MPHQGNARGLPTTAGPNKAMALRWQAEPVFQAWCNPRLPRFPAANGSLALCDSPQGYNLMPEPMTRYNRVTRSAS